MAAQGFSYNAILPAAEPDPLVSSDSLSISATVPRDKNLKPSAAQTDGPSVTVSQNWWPGVEAAKIPGGRGIIAAFGNSLAAGRVDWEGNLRRA